MFFYQAPAIVEAFYPAMRGAEALFMALTGTANRWGVLPVTVYDSSFVDTHSMTDFHMSRVCCPTTPFCGPAAPLPCSSIDPRCPAPLVLL